MDKLIPTLLLAILCIVIFWAMRAGWAARTRRQASLGNLPEVPARYEDQPSLLAVPGVYITTTVMGDWLDRISAHTLGVKATGTALVFDDALIIARDGAADLWIPASDILAIRTESGMAGKFVEKEGLCVISWTLGGQAVDTGFRTQYAADKKTLLTALRQIAPQALDTLPTQPTA